MLKKIMQKACLRKKMHYSLSDFLSYTSACNLFDAMGTADTDFVPKAI